MMQTRRARIKHEEEKSAQVEQRTTAEPKPQAAGGCCRVDRGLVRRTGWGGAEFARGTRCINNAVRGTEYGGFGRGAAEAALAHVLSNRGGVVSAQAFARPTYQLVITPKPPPA